MKRLKQIIAVFVVTIALSLTGSRAHAQSSSKAAYKKAYKTYQKAKSLAQTNQYETAIKKYKKAIQVAQQGGGKITLNSLSLPSHKYPSCISKQPPAITRILGHQNHSPT